MKSILWGLFGALFVCFPASARDVEGTWVYESAQHDTVGQPHTGSQDAVTTRYIFKRNNGVLHGRYVSYDGNVDLVDVTIKDNKLSFMKPGYGSTSLLSWHGIVEGSELRVIAPGLYSSRVYIFRRASSPDLQRIATEPTYTFKRLPLPQLYDIPSNGLALTPPMGIGNWVEPDENSVRRMADLMVASGMRDAGYVYVQLDEGWQGRRDAEGYLHPNKDIPDMKSLADYLHSRGLKLGLYSSPGPTGCFGYPGSHGHEVQDAKTFAAWGVDYLKYDWCSAMTLYHTQAEMQALYQKMGEALQQSGRKIIFALCQYGLYDVGAWGRRVGANLWRTSTDVQDSWDTISSNGFVFNGEPDLAGPGHWNDLDNLQVGRKGLTIEESKTQMTLWALSASPLFIQKMDNDIANWSPETWDVVLNKEVIAIDQDKVGIQGQRILKQGFVEVWSKRLSDGTTAVAVFNRHPYLEQTTNFRWRDIGISHVSGFRDVWRHVDSSGDSDRYEVSIPPRGTVLLKTK